MDFLLTRTQQDDDRYEDRAWFDLSLRSAMRGLDDEREPDYSEADLTERFS